MLDASLAWFLLMIAICPANHNVALRCIMATLLLSFFLLDLLIEVKTAHHRYFLLRTLFASIMTWSSCSSTLWLHTSGRCIVHHHKAYFITRRRAVGTSSAVVVSSSLTTLHDILGTVATLYLLSASLCRYLLYMTKRRFWWSLSMVWVRLYCSQIVIIGRASSHNIHLHAYTTLTMLLVCLVWQASHI